MYKCIKNKIKIVMILSPANTIVNFFIHCFCFYYKVIYIYMHDKFEQFTVRSERKKFSCPHSLVSLPRGNYCLLFLAYSFRNFHYIWVYRLYDWKYTGFFSFFLLNDIYFLSAHVTLYRSFSWLPSILLYNLNSFILMDIFLFTIINNATMNIFVDDFCHVFGDEQSPFHLDFLCDLLIAVFFGIITILSWTKCLSVSHISILY